MADAAEVLTFAFDENSKGLQRVLLSARAHPLGRITDLPSVGVPNGTLDPALMAMLGAKGRFALILRDGSMLEPILQRQAWKDANVTLFLLSKRWGQLPLFELSRRILFLWPTLVEYAYDGGQGAAWRVNPTIPSPGSNAFRLVTGRHADPTRD